MFSRPSAEDTEEDLLKFQEKFLASKSKPSVQVLKLKNEGQSSEDAQELHVQNVQPKKDVVTLEDVPDSLDQSLPAAPPLKKSRFGTGKVQKHNDRTDDKGSVSMQSENEDQQRCVEDVESQMDRADSHISKVLADIVEREFESTPVYFPQTTAFGGFPKVLHRGQIDPIGGASGGKKRSLFAQQFAKSSAKEFGLPPNVSHCSYGRMKKPNDEVMNRRQPVVESDTTSASSTNQSLTESQQIHKENIAKVESMSQAEILMEQKELLDSIDPSIVRFLRKRSATKQAPTVSTPVTSENNAEDISINNSATRKKITKPLTEKTDHAVLKPDKDWLHMDKVETEKIEWMKDLPEPAPADHKTGKPARFDLHGNLVAMDANLPTHLGLHHHGDEPERAGYTIGELFHLSRSVNIQQRTFAINVLAKIICNAKQGRFCDLVSTPLLVAMVEAGLVFILRWALDDKTNNTMAASVNALHALIVSSADEDGLDQVFCWYRGHEVSCVHPISAETDTQPQSADETPETMSDAEILKQDMIKGLVQMRLLPRLRYILEVWKPDVAVVLHILELLTTICRHSNQMAYEVMKCPRLLDSIVKDFLPWKVPVSWPEQLSTIYGLPSSYALRLVRVLCTSSRNIAGHVVSHYPLLNNMMLYISQAQQQSSSHPQLHNLVLESLRTWRILMAYGLAVNHYHEYYPLLMELLQKTCQVTCKSVDKSVPLSSVLICLLESVIHTAAKSTIPASKDIDEDRSRNIDSEMEHKTTPSQPEINWSHVCGLHQPILLCLQQQLDQFAKVYFDARYDLSFAGSCLNFIASWWKRMSTVPTHNAVDLLEEMETLCDKHLIPALTSRSFSAVLINLRRYSAVLCPETSKKFECLQNLSELGALVGKEMIPNPLLDDKSSMQFLLGFVNVLDAIRIHKGVSQKIYPLLLNHEELLQYLRQIINKANLSTVINSHFTRFENSLQLILVRLASFQTGVPDGPLYHHMALYLLTHIHDGSELDVHQLLSTVIFNHTLLSELHSTVEQHITADLDNKLEIKQATTVVGATQQEITIDKSYLLSDIQTNLMSIRNTYLAAFSVSQKALEMSRCRSEESSSYPSTFALGTSGQLLVPVDWQFLPLMEIYNMTLQPKGEQSVSRATTYTVTNCLRFVYYMEVYRPHCLDTVTNSLRFSRLVCTFLASNDLFLEPNIQMYLTALLQLYCKPITLDRMDFSKPVPGLSSFYDLYMLLLEQFSAVSFGDSVFGNYMLLPLQQRHDVMLRTAMWGEYAEALPALCIKINQVLIPQERFLDPEESNLELLKLYHRALFSHSVTEHRTPFLYLIAVHHINRFIYKSQPKCGDLAWNMIQSIVKARNQTLKHHLLHYKYAEKSKEHGMELYDVIPANRQSLLDRTVLS